METYIYVWLKGEPLGFHNSWRKKEGKGKEFASFGGEDFFRCQAWENAGADTEEEAELLLRHWLALKGISIGEPIRSIAPPDIVGAHNPHGDWTREKILPIVLGTLREMQFAEKDLEWSQWVVRDEYPLGIDFYPTKDHWGYFFPVFAETSAEEIASEVRTLAKNIFKLWEEEKPPLLGFERLMAERFPATYAMYQALTARS